MKDVLEDLEKLDIYHFYGTCIIDSPTTLLPDSELEKQSVERNARVKTDLPESRSRLAFLRKSIIFLWSALHSSIGGPEDRSMVPAASAAVSTMGKDSMTWSDLLSSVEGV